MCAAHEAGRVDGKYILCDGHRRKLIFGLIE